MIPEYLQWPDNVNCAITVCDMDGVILYMNDRAKETFASHGDLIGKNLFECHSISKNGLRKVIYQTPWRRDGKIVGMAEISMAVPEEMPHYIR